MTTTIDSRVIELSQLFRSNLHGRTSINLTSWAMDNGVGLNDLVGWIELGILIGDSQLIKYNLRQQNDDYYLIQIVSLNSDDQRQYESAILRSTLSDPESEFQPIRGALPQRGRLTIPSPLLRCFDRNIYEGTINVGFNRNRDGSVSLSRVKSNQDYRHITTIERGRLSICKTVLSSLFETDNVFSEGARFDFSLVLQDGDYAIRIEPVS